MIPGIGRARLSLIENYFDNIVTAWKAPEREYMQTGIDTATVQSILHWRRHIYPEHELEKAEKGGVQVFTYHDKNYPFRLKEIYDYPPVLYVKGSFQTTDAMSLAVVGTRKPTIYGRQITEELVSELSRNQIAIFSGLARGIDTISHSISLKNGGRTFAVLGSGINVIYPAENANLAAQITENGALISEYPIDTRPRAENFPRRNRILSGITLGTLVTEAGKRSGALITAGYALENNREVFAVPGSILSSQSMGTNLLIKQGAKLVQQPHDIYEELNLESIAEQQEIHNWLPENNNENELFQCLTIQPTHIDEICRTTGLPAGTVSSTLTMMELKGLVRQYGNMSYALTRTVNNFKVAK